MVKGGKDEEDLVNEVEKEQLVREKNWREKVFLEFN